jgi:hypothetical protein
MAFYRPLQRTDGRFDYVCTNSAGTFAIGYCFNGDIPFYASEWEGLSDVVKSLYGSRERWEDEKARHAPRIHEYHNTGHDTAEEAIACYRRYEVLEHTLRREDKNSKEKCAVCGEWTQHRVMVGTDVSREYAICVPCDSDAIVLNVHSGMIAVSEQ